MKDGLKAVGLTVYMRVNIWGVLVEAMVDKTLDLRMYYWTDSSKMTSDPYKGIVAICPKIAGQSRDFTLLEHLSTGPSKTFSLVRTPTNKA